MLYLSTAVDKFTYCFCLGEAVSILVTNPAIKISGTGEPAKYEKWPKATHTQQQTMAAHLYSAASKEDWLLELCRVQSNDNESEKEVGLTPAP